MILKFETYNFHSLDLTRKAEFVVTIYERGRAAARQHAVTADASAGV